MCADIFGSWFLCARKSAVHSTKNVNSTAGGALDPTKIRHRLTTHNNHRDSLEMKVNGKGVDIGMCQTCPLFGCFVRRDGDG